MTQNISDLNPLNPEEFAFDLGRGAIQRGALFIGLGLNLLPKTDIADFTIPTSKFTKIQILPAPKNTEEVENYKFQFSDWVIKSSIREFIELWGLFLNRLYQLILICLKDAGVLEIVKTESGSIYKAGVYGSLKTENNFNLVGIENKISYIKRKFDISSVHDEMFTQTAVLRHCYTHYASYMPYMYSETKEGFTYKWKTFTTEIKDNITGEVKDITYASEHVSTENESVIQLRCIEKAVNFPTNSLCLLSAEQIEEVLFSASLALSEIQQKFYGFARDLKSNGVG